MFYEGVFQNLAFCARVVRIIRKGLTNGNQDPLKMVPRGPKWLPISTQNGSPDTPRRPPTHDLEKSSLISPKSTPEPPKRHPKYTPKSQKVAPGCVFYKSKKTNNFRKHFCSNFLDSGKGRTSKIAPKHCRV